MFNSITWAESIHSQDPPGFTMGLRLYPTAKLWFPETRHASQTPNISLLKIHFGPICRTKFMSRNTKIRTVKIEIPLK